MLNVGDLAPEFEVPDHTGKLVKLSDYRGKTVVLWFYPRASTGGGTAEGCGFRDRIDDYGAKNVQILGVSTDDVKANAKFAEAQSFPYPLLCDTGREICVPYGACDDASASAAKRITYVIDADGRVAQAHAAVKASEHPETLLATL